MRSNPLWKAPLCDPDSHYGLHFCTWKKHLEISCFEEGIASAFFNTIGELYIRWRSVVILWML